jgi:signal recognition particle GTPase
VCDVGARFIAPFLFASLLLPKSYPANVSRRKKKQPLCILIAGPNGAGKTTFAREYLPTGAGVMHFVNVISS